MQEFIAEKREEIAELCRAHHVKRLSVFGSAVREDFDPRKSDVDLLVAFEPAPPVELVRNLEGLQTELVTLFGRPVDLIREGVIKNVYRLRSIERDKVLLYAA